MYHSNGLEYRLSSYHHSYYFIVDYLSKNVDDKYKFNLDHSGILEPYPLTSKPKIQYSNHEYPTSYDSGHSFNASIFLSRSRPKTRFFNHNNDITKIAKEIFELMNHAEMPQNISINILPLETFKFTHSHFGIWSNGILGFSINGANKEIFVRENQLDELIIVVGHEIGHVLTSTLPNKHDEEAKAFAFSIEWAKTIKKFNVANLGLSIKNEFEFQPARNGLHDMSFEFVSLMINQGRKALDLHDDLVKRYVSVFDRIY